MSFALELAQRANAIHFDTVPAQAIHVAKRAIADTLGVALAGCDAPFLDALEDVLESRGTGGVATKWGRAGKCSILHATLINATSAHALDFDDCSTTLGGHPSVPIVPAILALGESLDADMEQIITAYLTGFEVETRLARGVMPHHYEKGWHPTATLGAFGAAAAAARLLGFSDEQMATALAIAVSMASGLKSNFGTPVKPLQVGHAAHNGLLAALLTARGMTANHSAFEHNYGFFRIFNGDGTYSAEAVLGGWDGEMEVLNPGIAIKQHPCCGSAHSAIDAALKIVATHGRLDPNSIAGIQTWTHERRLAHTNRPTPRTGLDAKFSVQFLTAKALLDGRISLSDFDDASFITADIAALLPHVTAHAHQDSDNYLGRVRVQMVDGSVLEAAASTNFGRGPLNPMSDAELRSKFVDCAQEWLGATAGAEIFDAILGLSAKDKLTGILAAMAG